MTALLLRHYPELLGRLPHLPLGTGPTPFRPLPLHGQTDDASRVWVKDESGFGDGGWGGNKVRKLEWLLPDLQAKGRRRVISVGGVGTNWGLALARYAEPLGLDVELALIEQPRDGHVHRQLERLQASAARLHFTKSKPRTILTVPWLYLRSPKAAYLPAGGSSPLGALGYVEVALELAEQLRQRGLAAPDAIVAPVGSGGTVAGLLLGLTIAGLPSRVIGVVVNDTLPLHHGSLVSLAERARQLLIAKGARQVPSINPKQLVVNTDWLGEGYGVATPAALRSTGRGVELGLELEPVYTGKTLAALESWTSQASLTAPRVGLDPHACVVYLHTNGPRDAAG